MTSPRRFSFPYGNTSRDEDSTRPALNSSYQSKDIYDSGSLFSPGHAQGMDSHPGPHNADNSCAEYDDEEIEDNMAAAEATLAHLAARLPALPVLLVYREVRG